ncbi:MAG: TlpA family protein disulfide reductase [Bacteroidetes bacterium]|nr:TlpA family protein disulfide reductase [Bacteroidota bacterium]
MTLSKIVLIITLCALFPSAFASAQNNPLPDFTLPSATDTSHFTLSRERGSYIALHFLLKTECPYCIRHAREYIKKAPTLPGVQQIFIKPDTEEEIRAWAVKLSPDDPFPFPVYQDKDAALAERLGIPGGYHFHGQVVRYPALILLDPKGREVFRYVGTGNADRLPFEKFAEKVRELQRTK